MRVACASFALSSLGFRAVRPSRRSWTSGGGAGVLALCVLLFGVFAAYGSPCVPEGHSHDGEHHLAYTHVVNHDSPKAHVAHGRGHNDGGNCCQVDPPQAESLSSQQAVASPRGPLLSAALASTWVSHSQGVLGDCSPPCGRRPRPPATVPTGTAAQAVLCVSRI